MCRAIGSGQFPAPSSRRYARDTADRAAAVRGRAAEEDILPFRLDAPRACLFLCFREGKSGRVLENVPVVKAERFLDIDRAFAFDAETSITRDREAIFQRLGQPSIHPLNEFVPGLRPHRLVISREQTPRRIETEKRHGVETLRAQFR